MSGGASDYQRLWIAGAPLDMIGEADILELFERVVVEDRRLVLANLNLHGLYEALRTRRMLKLLRGQNCLVHIDGAPIAWMAFLLGARLPSKARNAHIDLIPKMLARCATQGWPVVIIGSDSAGAAANEEALARIAPGLNITGLTGFFDVGDPSPGSVQGQILDQIRSIRPKLLLVGMGMPRQEEWIAAVRDHQVDVPLIMPVGGFADYFAGRTRTPPRILGPLGMEWVYRLVHDPRRLAFRYLIEPFLLLGLLVRQTLSGAKWGKAAASTQVSGQAN